MRWVFALSFVLFGASNAFAQATITVEATPEEEPERNFGNLRVGATSAASRPELCLEVSPIELLSLEACGTGAGFLHDDPEPELAHFRAKLLLGSFRTELGWLQPQIGAGFAELQIGKDALGFDFTGTSGTGESTAGPELGASLRLLTPVASGFDVVTTFDLSMAYLPHAPDLTLPRPALFPTVTLTLGLGF